MIPSFFESKKSPIEGVPVIPDGTWYAGHLHLMREPDFQKSIHQFSVEHADEQGRCTFWMGPTTPSLSVTKYEDVQTLLKVSSHRELFPVMGWHMEQFFGRYNIAVLTGTEWKSKRAAIVKALHGAKVLEHNRRAFRQAAETLSHSLLQDRVTFVPDISAILKMLTLDAFGLASLNHDFGCCLRLQTSQFMDDFEYMSTEVLRRMTTDILLPTSHLYMLPTTANQKHQDAMKHMADYIHEIVLARRNLLAEAGVTGDDDHVPQDLLTSLIKNAAVAEGDGSKVSEQMLVDTIKSLLFAGYETSSVTLTFVLYLLSQNSEVEERCSAEIRARPDQPVYLEAVIKEAMRLYPPVISTTRSLERDIRFGGLFVPEGTYLYFPIWVIQRDARHFPDPLKFIPERWARLVKDSPSRTSTWKQRDFGEVDFEGVPAGNPKAFLAFSSGARSCAGQRFAVQEMTIALSILLKTFKFETPEDYVLTLHREGFVQCPKDGIPMRISRRAPPRMAV